MLIDCSSAVSEMTSRESPRQRDSSLLDLVLEWGNMPRSAFRSPGSTNPGTGFLPPESWVGRRWSRDQERASSVLGSRPPEFNTIDVKLFRF